MPMHLYQLVGRHVPTEKDKNPKLYRMKIFAQNEVLAKSRFWYFLSQLDKLKKYSGQILAVHEIFEKRPDIVKTYGVWLRYNSRSGTHNMYKEFRELTLNGAIDKLYAEMASLHRARFASIQIIKTAVIPADKARRPATLQFLNSKIKFPLPHRVSMPRDKKYHSAFRASRPNTYF
mmetsp:Transcript_5419/g.8425  ORF Transcript_5419/g.8425 Transcript_5419/m.8425 type:complete len:176 (+) Transcript_5419:38-565(+)|eukprot:CAMPEP_0184643922 /NCGR_PEP_ID=MMETSP0308-20130426/732_1 /TAXON_ID=38269 /ORGANISM="Gloeochaete witrockiana, Strain SAG 46.84" /LENGTH=175 /DNA_ID=CAMNT_0027072187 /DNA_START=38 /DNA_END=565 /DNA_ORIENTATION=-